MIVNAGHPEGNDDLETVLGPDDGSGLPDGAAPSDRGHEHAARRAPRRRSPRQALEERIASLPPEVRATAAEAAARLEPRLPGGDVYTDDRAPVEWLIDASFLGYAGDN